MRTAVRALRGNPAFSAVVVLTMAVAIAANTAIFSVADQLVLNPVSIPGAGSLVAIWFNNSQRNTQTPSMSIPRYDELKQGAQSFSSLGLSTFDSFTLTGAGEATQLTGLRVTASFLPTLRIMPARGRNFTEADEIPNGPAVCILSHEVWQTQFGGRELIGETIQLNGAAWEVVGIMPPRMTVPFRQVQVYAPRVFEVNFLTPQQIQNGATFAQPIARLRDGVTMEQARAELAAFSQGYKTRHPASVDANNINEPRPFVGSLVSGIAPTMYTLLAAVGCVLLIACANVASLFLSRLLKRRKDIAVRLSLGATRGRIVRDCLAETLIFAALSGALGALLAVWALAAMQSIVSTQLPPNTTLSLNWRALVFAAAASLACALLTGLFPALQASSPDLVEQLKDSSRGSSGVHGGRARKALIVCEVTLSVVLLVGAALLLSSFVKMQRTSAGFDPAGVAGGFVGLPPARYGGGPQQIDFYERVLTALNAQPGVTGAAVALSTPLTGSARTPYGIAGQPLPPLGQRPIVGMNTVSQEYFRVLGIAMAEGRGFTDDDRTASPAVSVVNETFAKRNFPGRTAIGEAIIIGVANRRVEIVGVIRDVKSNGVNAPTPEEAYFPLRQLPRAGMAVIARTAGDPTALQTSIRAAIASIDNTQALSFFSTMDSIVASSLGAQRLVATMTGVFAGIALLLSLTGLYSVLAYLVSQRTPEIGIRMALGATRRQVIGLVMRSGLGLVAVGIAAGLAGAAAGGRLIRQLLFGVEPVSVAIYARVAGIFAVVAVLACLGPSLRAARIDPLVAFRS